MRPIDHDHLLTELNAKYGPLLSPAALMNLLGFANMAALTKAHQRQALGLPTFRLPGRSGPFALTEDFVAWLLAARSEHATQEIATNYLSVKEGAVNTS